MQSKGRLNGIQNTKYSEKCLLWRSNTLRGTFWCLLWQSNTLRIFWCDSVYMERERVVCLMFITLCNSLWDKTLNLINKGDRPDISEDFPGCVTVYAASWWRCCRNPANIWNFDTEKQNNAFELIKQTRGYRLVKQSTKDLKRQMNCNW